MRVVYVITVRTSSQTALFLAAVSPPLRRWPTSLSFAVAQRPPLTGLCALYSGQPHILHTHVLVLAVTPVYTRTACKETETAIYCLKRKRHYLGSIMIMRLRWKGCAVQVHDDASRTYTYGVSSRSSRNGNARKGYVFIGLPEDAPGEQNLSKRFSTSSAWEMTRGGIDFAAV